jgi:sec-independent protein translocase protein TatB
MFNLDPGKLIVIAVVAIILLGPDKLPQVARQVGAAWRSFGEFRHRMESEVRSTLPDLPSTSEIARLARSPSALLNHLSSMSDGEERAAQDDVAGEEAAAAIAAATDGTQGAAAVPTALPGGNHDAGANDAGANGSGSAAAGAGAPQPRPPSEPVVQADPNLN